MALNGVCMNQLMKWIVAFAVIAMLGGCARTAPVDNIKSTVSAGHTEADVKRAILAAGMQNRWVMNAAAPGVIKARLQTRGHVAEARINYNTTSYSITYDSSLNLMASDGKIHKNYNRWVRNLDQAIQFNLSDSQAH
jgi:hypothetical protein